jgi:hypothetical protein
MEEESSVPLAKLTGTILALQIANEDKDTDMDT